MRTFSSVRAAVLLSVITALLVGMTGRVAYLQTYGREKTLHAAERQQHQADVLAARRGTIFDANGTLMAGTIQTRAVFIDPKFMQDYFQADGHSLIEMDQAIPALARLVDRDPGELSKALSDGYESRYLKIADNLDDATCDAIVKLNLPGVGFVPQNQRYYPMGSIAAHLLGGTGADGHGLDGLEKKFDTELAGIDGWKRTLKDARRNPIAVNVDDYRAPEHGQHLVLTIDANIQMIAEQELQETCEKYKAARGEVVVMDPHSGDVLAMANWPTFNPQNLEDSTPELRTNRALVVPYEPGSTIKPFIAGPALAWKVTRVDEVFPLHGPHYTTPYGRHITDVHGYDELAMWDVLVKSSNIGMSMLGERMGNEKIYRALTSFGFGRPTGIELPGENQGKVNPLAKWTKYSTESCSQGYELMVTPMQLARAFCAYANGGRLVQPHVLKGRLDGEGNIIARTAQTPFEDLPQVLDPKTADQVRRILCDVVIRGTAIQARSKIWNLFGKTGTAHIAEGHGYSETRFNSSFIGGAPYENPRLVVAFIVHDPDRAIAHYGGTVSAPGASKLLERALAYLQVEGSPDLPLPPERVQQVLYEFDPTLYTTRTASGRE